MKIHCLLLFFFINSSIPNKFQGTPQLFKEIQWKFYFFSISLTLNLEYV